MQLLEVVQKQGQFPSAPTAVHSVDFVVAIAAAVIVTIGTLTFVRLLLSFSAYNDQLTTSGSCHAEEVCRIKV